MLTEFNAGPSAPPVERPTITPTRPKPDVPTQPKPRRRHPLQPNPGVNPRPKAQDRDINAFMKRRGY